MKFKIKMRSVTIYEGTVKLTFFPSKMTEMSISPKGSAPLQDILI